MKLMDYLPAFYAGSAEVAALQNAIQPQTDALRAARDGFLAQLNVSTATTGLDAWESALGITKKAADGAAYRRTRILSKLRGAGTTTEAMIRTVAESFSNGDVEIVQDPASYAFVIKFVGTLGIPPNMDDLTAAVEEIRPAHLAYSYEYTFRTWAMLAGYKWADLAAVTWQQAKEGEI